MTDFDIQAGRIGAILLCLLAINFSSTVLAQAETTETVPQPPPSVETFSLPPGDNAPAPQPAPTGPVDDSAVPPIATPDPDPPEPAPTESIENDEPVATSVPANAPQEVRPATPEIQPSRPDPRPSPTRTRPSPEPETTSSPSEVRNDAPEADDPAAEEIPLPAETTELPRLAATDPPLINVDQSSEQPTSYIAIPLITLLLIGLGLFIWRRRRKAKDIDNDDFTSPTLSEPKPEENPETEVVEPTPTPEPSEPIVETKPDVKRSSNGFVTTKIRKTEPAPQSKVTTEPTKPALSNRLNIEFHAESASSTLLNAVVGYRLVISNNSDQSISNLRISGTMIQADKNLIESAASSQGQLLHDVGDLKAEQEEQVSGDIRLPLTAFQPIDFQSQKLFVPLVLLRFDYIDGDGNAQMQAVNYLVGTEHKPPREKMAPFRLDLGPRNFGEVAHRAFQS